MNKRNAIEWMLGEVDGLVGSGVITPECGEALRRHYSGRLAETETGARTALLSVIGAALIGAGVILLIAHNWDELGRPVRTMLAVLPLIVSGALSMFAAWRRAGSVAWRESAGVAHCAGVAASIALVSQTYHISGNLSDFLFTWLVLILPLPYLLRAVCPAIIYLAGIAVWAVVYASHMETDSAPGYWLFLAGVIPFYARMLRKQRLGRDTAWLSATLAISIAFGLGAMNLRGAWVPAFAGFSTLLYLAGALGFPERQYYSLRLLGGLGIAVMTFALSFGELWDNLPMHWKEVAWPGGAFAIGLPCAAIALAMWAFSRKGNVNPVAAVFPVVASATYVYGLNEKHALAAALSFNLYGIALALATAFRGLQERAALTLNAGLILFAALLVSRFMDEAFGALERGVAFILLGALILWANLWMLRKKEAAR